MTVTVTYGRHYGIYTEEFSTLEEAAKWVETQEDMGNIFASEISEDGRLLFEHEVPPADRRWKALTGRVWPGGYP